MGRHLSQALAIATLLLGFADPAAAQNGTPTAPQGYYYDINGNLRHISSLNRAETASGAVIYSGSATNVTTPIPTPTTTYSVGTTAYPSTVTNPATTGAPQYPSNTVGNYDYRGGVTYDTPAQPPAPQDFLYPVPTLPTTGNPQAIGVTPNYHFGAGTWIQPLRWTERLGEFLPVIEACMVLSNLHDLKATAIYEDRERVPHVRMVGRSTSSVYSTEIAQDCVVQHGETRLRNIPDGNAGLQHQVRTAYIPAGTRFPLPDNAVITPVIDDRRVLIGWLVREARRVGDRLGEAIIIAGYPQK